MKYFRNEDEGGLGWLWEMSQMSTMKYNLLVKCPDRTGIGWCDSIFLLGIDLWILIPYLEVPYKLTMYQRYQKFPNHWFWIFDRNWVASWNIYFVKVIFPLFVLIGSIFFSIKIRLQLKICHFLSSLQYSELTRNWNLIWIVSENPVLFWNIIFIMFVLVVKRNFHKNQILLKLTFSLIFYCRAARIKILSPGTVLLERWLNGFNCGWYLHFNN